MKADGTLALVVANGVLGAPGTLSFALGNDGLLHIADTGNGSYHARVLHVEASGVITVLLYLPTSNRSGTSGIAFGPEGALYFSDSSRQIVYKRGTDGIVVPVAGVLNSPGLSGDGELANQAQLSPPGAVAVGPDGTLYIADMANLRVRAVGTDGKIRTFAGGTYL